MDTDYTGMSAAELESELEQLLDKLDDTEILRDSVLGQSGNHVSGGYVKRFSQEISELNARIDVVKAALTSKK